MKKKLIFTSILILIVVASLGIGFHFYQNYKTEKLIETANVEITAFSEKISAQEDRTKKFELLSDFMKKSEEYKSDENYKEQISKRCFEEICKIKSEFKEEYNKILSEHTLKDINKVSDFSIFLPFS